MNEDGCKLSPELIRGEVHHTIVRLSSKVAQYVVLEKLIQFGQVWSAKRELVPQRERPNFLASYLVLVDSLPEMRSTTDYLRSYNNPGPIIQINLFGWYYFGGDGGRNHPVAPLRRGVAIRYWQDFARRHWRDIYDKNEQRVLARTAREWEILKNGSR